jgi:hypothetical protein
MWSLGKRSREECATCQSWGHRLHKHRVHRSESEVGSFPARKAVSVDPMVVVRFELVGVCALDSRVIGANVRGKLFVALQLEVAHHLIERCAGERTGSLEPPVTLGATETPKTLFLNPYQLPAHGLLCRCAPTLSDRMPSTRLPSRDETFSSSQRRTA